MHLYEEHGPAFVEGLRGMFAVALWDARRRTLVLARDPYGIKPLVYARLGRRLAFASELKALLALPDVPARDRPGRGRALSRAERGPRARHDLPRGAQAASPGTGSSSTPGACSSSATRGRGRCSPARCGASRSPRWRWRRRSGSPRPCAHTCRPTRPSACCCRAGSTRAWSPPWPRAPVKTFSVGFDVAAFDELAGARAVAERYGTDHHELRLGPEAALELEGVAATYDEPSGDATALPYWLLARFAAREVKAVLTGEGADELFGGYQTYAAGPARCAGRARRGGAGARRRAVPELLGAPEPGLPAAPARARRRARPARTPPRVQGDVQPRAAARDAGPERRPARAAAGALRRDARGRADRAPAGRRCRLVPRRRPPPPGRPRRHGARPRGARPVPGPRRRRARVRAAGPRARARAGDEARAARAAAPLLPAEVVRGPKRGFCTPVAAWLRGPLEPFARDLLSPERVARQGWFAPGRRAATCSSATSRAARTSGARCGR